MDAKTIAKKLIQSGHRELAHRLVATASPTRVRAGQAWERSEKKFLSTVKRAVQAMERDKNCRANAYDVAELLNDALQGSQWSAGVSIEADRNYHWEDRN